MTKDSSCWNLAKAIFTRLILSGCIVLTSWRAATVTGGNTRQLPGPTNSDGSFNPDFLMTWLPCAGIILYIPELVLTMILNKGHEFKWWWPYIAIFLACNIPNVWFIELDMQNRFNSSSDWSWSTETLSNIDTFNLPLSFTPPVWARFVEQISFLVLIIVKWLSPKGLTSHEKLSQLLLYFVGMASDILDLMDNLHDELMKLNSDVMVYIVLVCYTTSHLQFSFNYTARRKYKLRWSSDETDVTGPRKVKRKIKYVCCCCFESELWVLLTTIFSMDGWFFAIRLYLFLGLKIVTFGNIFFATKNGVIMAIDIYRIISVLTKMHQASKHELDEQRRPDLDDGGEDDDEDIDEDRIVDMHLIIESDGVIMASARTLRHETNAEKMLVRKKKTWELNAVSPQWANRSKKGKTQIVVPGAELHLIYELEFVFDHSANNDDSNDRVFKSIKEVHIRDAINSPGTASALLSKPKRAFSSNSIHPMEQQEEDSGQRI